MQHGWKGLRITIGDICVRDISVLRQSESRLTLSFSRETELNYPASVITGTLLTVMPRNRPSNPSSVRECLMRVSFLWGGRTGILIGEVPLHRDHTRDHACCGQPSLRSSSAYYMSS
jgi:hypothetical protein